MGTERGVSVPGRVPPSRGRKISAPRSPQSVVVSSRLEPLEIVKDDFFVKLCNVCSGGAARLEKRFLERTFCTGVLVNVCSDYISR